MTGNTDLGTLAKLESQLVNFHKGTTLIQTDTPSDTASVHSWKFDAETHEKLEKIGEDFRVAQQRLQTLETKLKTKSDQKIAPEIETLISDLREKERTFATHKYAEMVKTIIGQHTRMRRYFEKSQETAQSEFDKASTLHKTPARARVKMGTVPELKGKKLATQVVSVPGKIAGKAASKAIAIAAPGPGFIIGPIVGEVIAGATNIPGAIVDAKSQKKTDAHNEHIRHLVRPEERSAFAKAFAIGTTLMMGEELTDPEDIDPGTDRDKDPLKTLTKNLQSGWDTVRRKPGKQQEAAEKQRAKRDTSYLFKDMAFDPELTEFLNDWENGTPQKLERVLKWVGDGNNSAQKKLQFKESIYCLYDPPGIAAENDFLSALKSHEHQVSKYEELANNHEDLTQQFTQFQEQQRINERAKRTKQRQQTLYTLGKDPDAPFDLSPWNSASEDEQEATRLFEESRAASNPPTSPTVAREERGTAKPRPGSPSSREALFAASSENVPLKSSRSSTHAPGRGDS